MGSLETLRDLCVYECFGGVRLRTYIFGLEAPNHFLLGLAWAILGSSWAFLGLLWGSPGALWDSCFSNVFVGLALGLVLSASGLQDMS